MTVNRVNAGEMMRAKQIDLLSYLEAKGGKKFKKRKGTIIAIWSMIALSFEIICMPGTARA
ncbi:hypothetical protein GCM10020331_008260 [Ectobacillus funiculus]